MTTANSLTTEEQQEVILGLEKQKQTFANVYNTWANKTRASPKSVSVDECLQGI